MTGVLTVRKTQSNKDDDELVLSLPSTCLVVGDGKKIHRRRTRRRAAENLLQNQMVFVTKGWQSGFWSMKRLKISVFLQNQKDFVRIGSHNFGKNIYHYQTAAQTILSCRARGWGEAYKTHHASDVPKLHSCPHKHLPCKWKRQRNKTVAASRDERRVGSLFWNLRPSSVSRNLPRDDDDDANSLLEPTYLRPSPVNRNLPRDDDDDDDDAKSLLWHWQRPILALGKSLIRKKNLQGVSCKQVALLNRPLSAATFARSLARSTASFQIRRTRAPRTTKLCVRPTLPGTRYSSFFGSIDIVILLQQVARTS